MADQYGGDEIYCICRSTDISRFMIGCDQCDEWFHGDCIKLDQQEANFIDSFFCELCRKKDPSLKIIYKAGYEPERRGKSEKLSKDKDHHHHKHKHHDRDKDRGKEREKDRERHGGEKFSERLSDKNDKHKKSQPTDFESFLKKIKTDKSVLEKQRERDAKKTSSSREKKHTRRCGLCDGCRRLEDCGRCTSCKDMPKYGGPGNFKQKCRARACSVFSKENTKAPPPKDPSPPPPPPAPKQPKHSSSSFSSSTKNKPSSSSSSSKSSNKDRQPSPKPKESKDTSSSSSKLKESKDTSSSSSKLKERTMSQKPETFESVINKIDIIKPPPAMRIPKKKPVTDTPKPEPVSEIDVGDNKRSFEIKTEVKQEEPEVKIEPSPPPPVIPETVRQLSPPPREPSPPSPPSPPAPPATPATPATPASPSPPSSPVTLLPSPPSQPPRSPSPAKMSESDSDSDWASPAPKKARGSKKATAKKKKGKAAKRTSMKRQKEIYSYEEYNGLGIESHYLPRSMIQQQVSYRQNSSQQLNDDEPRQCYGPNCTEPARQGSKYCSDDCGLKLATTRIFEILPQRIQNWHSSPCLAEEADKVALERVRADQLAAKQKLEDLERKQQQLSDFISKVKQYEPASAHDSQDEETDSDQTVFCITCGHEVGQKTALKHMEKCFQKFESLTAFGTTFPSRIGGNIFCDAFHAASATYCKRLKVLCPEHSKEPKAAADEVCGCPLQSKQFKDTGEVCRNAKRKCNKHPAWERMRRAEIDLERLRQWMKLDELFEKEQNIRTAMSNRAGVLSLMLHQTIDHDAMKPILKSAN